MKFSTHLNFALKKFRNKVPKLLFALIPIAILTSIMFSTTSILNSITNIADKNIFDRLEAQNKVIEVDNANYGSFFVEEWTIRSQLS